MPRAASSSDETGRSPRSPLAAPRSHLSRERNRPAARAGRTSATPAAGMTVAVGGSPYFGRRMAELLSGDGWRADYLETRGWRPDAAIAAWQQVRRAAVLYQLGGQVGRFSRPHTLLATVRRPCVMHWTGSDVLYARQTVRRGQATARLRDHSIHWAGAPWLVDELADVGIRATWLPHSAIDAPATLPPFGDQFTVLAYLRAGREDFYGAAAVRRVAAALPAVRVLVAGCNYLTEAPMNVTCLGWVDDMAPIYARSHVLLRLTAHDGLAFMVQEALAAGRYAVWNHPFPGTLTAGSAEQAAALIADLAGRHAAGSLSPNECGACHVRERFNRRRVIADLRAGLRAAVEEGR